VLFNSYVFIFAFLPLVLLGWWGIRRASGRLVFLTLASYVFYGWWDWRFVPLMIVSSSADLVAGAAVARASTPGRKRLWLALLLIFNLGLLGFFKYYDFCAANLNVLAGVLGQAWQLPLLNVVLPIGISFYTFNSISYTIDIYRNHIKPTRSVLAFSTFVAMFPHLVAGPIIRYADMDEQFTNLPERPTPSYFVVGAWFLVLGMVKKVLVADVIAASFVTPLFGVAESLRLLGAWIATLAYTAQIYFDFSGYSDMAVGLAFLLGLRFPQNFDSPYKARSIADFWRRWHMSLSFWLRDYLFIPLGGSHGGRLATLRNLALTMFLGGLWHGASWTFAVWGLYHGALLVVHALLRRVAWLPRVKPLSIAVTFLCVTIGWVFFRAASLGQAWGLLSAMLGRRGVESGAALDALLLPGPCAVLAGAFVIAFVAPNTWQIKYPRSAWAAVAVAVAFFVCVLRFAKESPFLYFQF
jgi:alginate O-acetyltransferase complex protein AlgI